MYALRTDSARAGEPASFSTTTSPPRAGRYRSSSCSYQLVHPSLQHSMTVVPTPPTPADIRQLCRADKFRAPATANLCDGHVQANVVVLPNKYAADFRALCARNSVPFVLLLLRAPPHLR